MEPLEFQQFQDLLLQEFPKGSREMSQTMGQRRISITGGALDHVYKTIGRMIFIQRLKANLPPDVTLYNFDDEPLKEWIGIGYGSDLFHIRFISQNWERHLAGEEIPVIDMDALAYYP